MNLDDVIAAVSTPHGEGAIGIVRACGYGAFGVAAKLIQGQRPDPESWAPGRARHRVLRDPRTGERLDDALVLAFDARRSAVGLDLVEFQCHGSPLILSRVLDALLAAGARPANPGEFSLRAFLCGKMDLAQAEAVCDLIRARTQSAQRLAMRQQAGGLSKEVAAIRGELEGLLAHLEASIDFGEEIGDVPPARVADEAARALSRVDALIATGRIGRPYREGVRLAIVGRPNVGKSSLLNALLRRDRAIVADTPGTTRDTIEEEANILGIPVVAVDTAGLRQTQDALELLGIRRTEEAASTADLVLVVVDASAGWGPDDAEAVRRVGGGPMLCVLNKIDLVDEARVTALMNSLPPMGGEWGAAPVSARTRAGLDALERAIARALTGSESLDPDGVIVSNARHLEALREASAALARVVEAARASSTPDLLAVDLRAAAAALGRITGDDILEGLLDRVFSEFCIGK